MICLPLKAKTVVIVDGYDISADSLSDRFRKLGAIVHVVSSAAAAAVMVRNKKVDIVFVGYRHGGRAELKHVLEEHRVRYITCAAPTDMNRFALEFKGVADLIPIASLV